MFLESVVVEFRSKKCDIISYTGTSLNNSFILLTSQILSDEYEFPKIPIGLHPSDLFFPECTFEVSSKTGTKLAKLIGVLSSGNVRNSVTRFLQDFKINFQKERINQDVFSVFFILSYENKRIEEGMKVLRELYEGCAKKWGMGDKVFVESAPFGNKNFLGFYSEGIVGNVLGQNGCFIASDCPTVGGSEGSLIFLKKKKEPIGIVVSSVSWWKGEWLGITLGVTLQTLLSEIWNYGSSLELHQADLYNLLRNAVVQVVSGINWGSGILLDKSNGLFLTNYHVVENEKCVEIHWKKFAMKANVVFITNLESDIALLKVAPKDLKIVQNSKMAPLKNQFGFPKIGDQTLAVGFPLFPASLNTGPTITSGNISLLKEGLIFTTCTTIPGASGGALVNSKGNLIGMVTSNIKLQESSAVFPKISISISTSKIYQNIQTVMESGGLEQPKIKMQGKNTTNTRGKNMEPIRPKKSKL